jgi:hypothetical protein
METSQCRGNSVKQRVEGLEVAGRLCAHGACVKLRDSEEATLGGKVAPEGMQHTTSEDRMGFPLLASGPQDG